MNNMRKRNYRREYEQYQGTKEQKLARASRNAARRKMEAKGNVSPGDGLDVHHVDHNPRNNASENLRAFPRPKNRRLQ